MIDFTKYQQCGYDVHTSHLTGKFIVMHGGIVCIDIPPSDSLVSAIEKLHNLLTDTVILGKEVNDEKVPITTT